MKLFKLIRIKKRFLKTRKILLLMISIKSFLQVTLVKCLKKDKSTLLLTMKIKYFKIMIQIKKAIRLLTMNKIMKKNLSAIMSWEVIWKLSRIKIKWATILLRILFMNRKNLRCRSRVKNIITRVLKTQMIKVIIMMILVYNICVIKMKID